MGKTHSNVLNVLSTVPRALGAKGGCALETLGVRGMIVDFRCPTEIFDLSGLPPREVSGLCEQWVMGGVAPRIHSGACLYDGG